MVDSRVAVEEAIPSKIAIEREGEYFKVRVDYRTFAWERCLGRLEDALEWVKEFTKS